MCWKNPICWLLNHMVLWIKYMLCIHFFVRSRVVMPKISQDIPSFQSSTLWDRPNVFHEFFMVNPSISRQDSMWRSCSFRSAPKPSARSKYGACARKSCACDKGIDRVFLGVRINLMDVDGVYQPTGKITRAHDFFMVHRNSPYLAIHHQLVMEF